ncbi:hypothetical protein ASC87_07895 [Rhizobacter sp. Root1221]|nr:hypothetical protein ASC87_07895 [Rhizobacter sp. Root1221]
MEHEGVIRGYHAHVAPRQLECHLVSGAFDYLVKMRVREMEAYRRLLGDILRDLLEAAESHSHSMMEETKEGLVIAVAR